MKSNDLGKRLATRFKKSKDFLKTIEKLQKEGYTTRLKARYTDKNKYSIVNGGILVEKTNEKEITYYLSVYQNNIKLIYIMFELRPVDEEYKQYILEMKY